MSRKVAVAANVTIAPLITKGDPPARRGGRRSLTVPGVAGTSRRVARARVVCRAGGQDAMSWASMAFAAATPHLAQLSPELCRHGPSRKPFITDTVFDLRFGQEGFQVRQAPARPTDVMRMIFFRCQSLPPG
jgi:hypothetical protein